MGGKYSSIDERESKEISRLLEDKVSLAILTHIVDRGRCTQEDLENLDAVKKESKALLQSLIDCGFIEESNGELKITEEGLNLLKTLREYEVISEDTEHSPDMIVRG